MSELEKMTKGALYLLDEVAFLRKENAALRAVAVAAADFRTAWANGDEDTETYDDILDDKLAAARVAGYLPDAQAEGVAS